MSARRLSRALVKLLTIIERVVFPAFLFSCHFLAAQVNTGELRLRVTDPHGAGMKAAVNIESESNEYHTKLSTDENGKVEVHNLPYGAYTIEIEQPGFGRNAGTVQIRSAVPVEYDIRLRVETAREQVNVRASEPLINTEQAGAVNQIGSAAIKNRVTSLPGRSLQDLVNTQPGWLYEGNAVLHPRGSEYQTQFVVDGVPLTDNRSPSFGPELEVEDVQSMSIYTAGIPAEYGRKMGGVIELNTLRDPQAGFHGDAALSGGSFDSAGAYAQGQYAWGDSVVGASASGSMTDHYLNPVVPQNYSNTGTLGNLAATYQNDFTPNDRLNLSVRHELARYDIPNEFVQESAGQRQTANNIDTMGIASYQHIFSAHVVADVHGMVRDNSDEFNSNTYSTPIEVFQNNGFREGYFKSTATVESKWQEWKFGVESDNTFLNENFRYNITDSSQFDPATPKTFTFAGNRPQLEQSGFAQDLIRLGKWTINAGLRWDHYQLVVNEQELQPRIAVARYFPGVDAGIHFAYDRVFQTPDYENILLSSSANVESLNPQNFLHLPVHPSQGNYYETGFTKGFSSTLRADATYFWRVVNNYADDDQIQNTTVSFPIAFRKSVIYGAEGKIELLSWHRLSGLASYSYMVGNAWFPVTGGLFLGGDATNALSNISRHFPVSQDQRNSVRGRLRYQVTSRCWIAAGMQYDSGLPFEFDGDPQTVLAEYGQHVLDRINFERGRINPALLVSASIGAEIYRTDRVSMHIQADGQNLTNVLDLIDFGGLFSGNAIGPSRSFSLRWSTTF
jgi:hypothetical protein